MASCTETTLGPAKTHVASAYRTEAVEGRGPFDGLRGEWNALVARGPVDLPFVRHEWIAAWLDAFAPGAPLRVIVARDRLGQAVGMAPLLEERRSGMVHLLAPANDHSCRVEWALGPDVAGAVGAIWAHVRDRLRWDVLLLRDLPRDGPTATHLEALARADRHPSGRWEAMRSPWVPLGGGPVEARVSAKLRQNLRRRLRRLSELGAVSVRRIGGTGDLARTFDEFLALEAAGWKGARGTAIARDPKLVRFYRAVVEGAAARGTLALRALELDGRAIAVHLGLVHAGSYHLPKTAYDEALAAVSPGQLLQREVLAECEARGLAAFEFLGPDMAWKRDWEPRHRPHDWLYVYRPGLVGRAMHTLKHRVRPAVKGVAGWWR